MNRGVLGALLIAASCGVRAPARIDIDALVKARGEVEARRDLEVRVIASPKDLSARLALAALAERAGRPSTAIEQLEAVRAVGGPIGTRWHADDRARLGRLLLARGRLRVARAAPSALGDLTRAREFGATVAEDELRAAKIASAIHQLRHVDAKLRAAGKLGLADLAKSPGADPSWVGASANAPAEKRGAFGMWLWKQGAKRAAWEELKAWHDATRTPDVRLGTDSTRDVVLGAAYLEAYAWWTPFDAAKPQLDELEGPARCRFALADCEVEHLLADEPIDDAAIAALLVAPPTPRTVKPDANGWLVLSLRQALRGESAWGAVFAARVDHENVSPQVFDPALRATFTRLVGRPASPTIDPSPSHRPLERVVIAAGRVLRGAPVAEVRRVLGPAAETDEGRALLRIVEPRATTTGKTAPYVAAAIAYVRARVPAGPDADAVREVVVAYRRDPAIADRLVLDLVARAGDAALGHAACGALFDALGDPARARIAWQAAVDSSPEREHLRGLAETLARASDPDAAMIAGTTAAAAWGDPAAVWVSVARSLDSTREYQHALEAARMAIDLGSSELLVEAIDIAVSSSLALERDVQVMALLSRREQIASEVSLRDDDPTDAVAALAAHHARPTAATIARMWVASRWNARDVATRAALFDAIAPDDPRRAVLASELVALAADRDPDRGRAAVAALR